MELREKRDESVRRILEAAMSVFAEEGYSGARVDEIAKRAGLNKAMIYYRIGDKLVLYTEVIHSLFGDIGSAIKGNIPADATPEEKLKIYIRGLALTIADHPYLPGIMMRELASGGGNISELVAEDFASILSIPANILTEGVNKGAFIKTNPVILHMMVVGFMMFFRTTEPVRKRYFERLPEDVRILNEKSISEGVNEVERLVLRAIKA
ncbi:MAG: TetR/AcrR family transcriptional regulator [Deltaproteobacteria bacterium]|nr:TetR/AcrR family transcriptional regulator [Deltaproteobacteria bacterium]